jgi:hypothetical protein
MAASASVSQKHISLGLGVILFLLVTVLRNSGFPVARNKA